MFSWLRRKKKPAMVEEVRFRVLDSDLYPQQYIPEAVGTFASKLDARNAVRAAGYDPHDFLYAPVAVWIDQKEHSNV